MTTRITVTVTTSFTVRPAQGPNPHNKALEVVDADGDRFSYAADLEEAEATLYNMASDAADMNAYVTIESIDSINV